MSQSDMASTSVVTGASGFIGSHLVEELLSSGYRVIGIDNLRTGNQENLIPALELSKFQFFIGDILDESLYTKIPEHVDILFHLAAISSVRKSIEDPVHVNDVNVLGTVRMLELARRLDIEHVVFSSSAAVYGDPEVMPVREEFPYDPLSPYAASKIAGEMYLKSYSKSYGIDTTILRYFNVYGPRQAYSEYSGVISIFINQALSDLPITIEGDGLQTRSFIHVKDTVRATRLAGQRDSAESAVINISGPELISILDIARRIKRSVNGCTSEIVHKDARVGDVRDSIGSMERARKLLDFSPEIPLDQGLKDTAQWYRNYQTSK
ncbi:NAD-dependent epimerase/dehydratase family protein [Candidatus Thorarchaeota archaeon]|nr:MAG: NAD-dependent epimerase/dehydratase family protein [Candidatus Thorarchaeota archaeon]